MEGVDFALVVSRDVERREEKKRRKSRGGAYLYCFSPHIYSSPKGLCAFIPHGVTSLL